jgi:hypothetical protein
MAKQAVATIGDKAQEVETSLGNATESYKTNSGSKFCLQFMPLPLAETEIGDEQSWE